jgi:hypothetical protein
MKHINFEINLILNFNFNLKMYHNLKIKRMGKSKGKTYLQTK